MTSNADDELGVEVPTPTCAKEDKERASKVEKNKPHMFLFLKVVDLIHLCREYSSLVKIA